MVKQKALNRALVLCARHCPQSADKGHLLACIFLFVKFIYLLDALKILAYSLITHRRYAMKYLSQINIKNNGGCYRTQSDSLDEIRRWAKRIGKAGDELLIMKNGDKIGNSRIIIL